MFMPYHLYYDTQTMMKNIVFCIYKKQVFDLGEKFFIGDSSDDLPNQCSSNSGPNMFKNLLPSVGPKSWQGHILSLQPH